MSADKRAVFRDLSVTVAGLRIHCLTAGTGGRPILILHGGGLDAAGLSFGSAISVLARNRLVFAPDWPGFGESAAMPSGWRVEECVTFLAALLQTLGLERTSLMGLSMGGGFALGCALQFPPLVEQLVLVNSFGLGKEAPGGLAFYLRVHVPLVSELTWTLVTWNRALARRTLRAAVFPRSEIATETLLDEVVRFARKPGAGAAFRQLQRSELLWDGFRTNYLARLPELQVPTLIVHGARDPLVPAAWAERAHRLIPNSELEIIDQCGHLPPVEQPEIFNQIIERFFAVH
jgi:pimeloyl-ACP methyl ester carboxylesterase